MSNAPGGGFGVYVHWPFCTRICPYCDFNAYRDRGVDTGRWMNALEAELAHWAARTGPRPLTSVYFGGGTPSLADPSIIAAVIDACDRLWGFDGDPEITLEANPTDAERQRFGAFSNAGVNRLSLGVQSLDDAALKFLGRNHDAEAGLRAIAEAQSVFARVSADLIYALPGQSDQQWADQLGALLATGITHLSAYQLTIEPGTQFERAVAARRWTPADDDRSADLYDLTQALTAAAGLPAYEISNHAAPGGQSRHNLIYWRQGDYIGVGPGAHGRLTLDGRRYATETALSPDDYLQCVETEGCGTTLFDPLSEDAVFTERIAMSLRTVEGTALSPAEWRAVGESLAALQTEGMLTREGDRLIATSDGRRLLNAVIARLLG